LRSKTKSIIFQWL